MFHIPLYLTKSCVSGDLTHRRFYQHVHHFSGIRSSHGHYQRREPENHQAEHHHRRLLRYHRDFSRKDIVRNHVVSDFYEQMDEMGSHLHHHHYQCDDEPRVDLWIR